MRKTVYDNTPHGTPRQALEEFRIKNGVRTGKYQCVWLDGSKDEEVLNTWLKGQDLKTLCYLAIPIFLQCEYHRSLGFSGM